MKPVRSQRALQIRIDELLLDNGMTLNGLAKVCGIKQTTLFNIMSGRNNSVSVATVLRICMGLGMDLPTFFDADVFRSVEQEIC